MKTAQDLIDLLEAVSYIDKDDMKAMLDKFGYEAVEHKIIRATSNLEDLSLNRLEIYYELLNTK